MKAETESLKDLINWINSQPKKRKKVKIDIDKTVYGKI